MSKSLLLISLFKADVLKKGETALNHGYSRINTPVHKNPCLFHQYTTRSTASTYYPAQYTGSPPVVNAYRPTPALYAHQSDYNVQSTLPYTPKTYPSRSYPSHAYPYYPTQANFSPTSSIPFSTYSAPTFSYAPTASSNGLAIILIATLVLVALDLIIVRPQKGRMLVN